ncbi:MAG: hypothetical protein KG075_09405 [Alphaproteobacteria bacterium]|nr:hypothetical protein [Alphaproteobacteria bacterium]
MTDTTSPTPAEHTAIDMEIALKSDAVCLAIMADICADKGMTSLSDDLLRIRENMQAAVNERASLLERVRKLEEALQRLFSVAAIMRFEPDEGRPRPLKDGVYDQAMNIARSALQPEQETA